MCSETGQKNKPVGTEEGTSVGTDGTVIPMSDEQTEELEKIAAETRKHICRNSGRILMDGVLYPENGIVEFNLNEAVQLVDE